MGMLICYGFIFLAEGIIVHLYFDSVFERKTKKTFCLLTYVIGYVSMFLLSQIESVLVNGVSFLIINLLIVFLNYKSKVFSGLFHVGIVNIVMFTSELIVAKPLSFLTNDFDAYLHNVHVALVFSVTSRLIFFMILQVSAKMMSKDSEEKVDNRLISISIFPIMSIVVGYTLCYICISIHLPLNLSYLMMLSILLLLFMNILFMVVYNNIQRINRERLSYQLQLHSDQAKEEYYHMLEEQHDNQRTLIHDINKHLGVLRLLLQNEKYGDAQNYLGEVIDNSVSAFRSIRYSDEPVLNAVLSRYQDICNKNRVSFGVDVEKHAVSHMNKGDITSLFDNLLSNAYEAAVNSDAGYIDINIAASEFETIIKIDNSCSDPPTLNSEGNLVTKKIESQYHGIGMKSIARIVQKYSGDMLFQYCDVKKEFTVIISMQKKIV